MGLTRHKHIRSIVFLGLGFRCLWGPLQGRYTEALVTSIFPVLQLTLSAAVRDHRAFSALAEHGATMSFDSGTVGTLFFDGRLLLGHLDRSSASFN